MAKSSFLVVLIAVFAGAAAGMAVQFLDSGPEASESGPATGSVTAVEHSEVESIARRDENRINQLEIAIEELRSEIGDQQKQITDLTAKLTEYEKDGATAAEMKVVGPDGKPMAFAGKPGMMRFGKAGKGFELMGMSEEDRWAKLREELSLDSYQESELKQIAKDYRESFKDMFKPSEDGELKVGKIDIAKIMKAKQESEERVKNLLSEQQYDKFKKEGYGAALGMGGTTSVSVSTSFGTSEGK